MNKLGRRRRYRRLGAIALAVAAFVSLLNAQGLLERLEWISYDARMSLARRDAVLPEQIAVVLIDDASLQALDPVVGRFPWPRSLYADVIEFLLAGEPRAIVFDILFTENQRGETESRRGLGREDAALAAATEISRITYHALQLTRAAPERGPSPSLPPELATRHGRGPLAADHGYRDYLLPLPALTEASRGLGAVGLDADRDGVYRRLRPLHAYQGLALPALAIVPLTEAELTAGALPVDATGQALIHAYGRIPVHSLSGLFASAQKLRRGEVEGLLVSPEEFRDKIVFIGASAVGLQDVKRSSLGAGVPGVFLHAAFAGNVLSGDFLRPLPPVVTYLAIGLLTALVALCAVTVPGLGGKLLLPMALMAAFAAVAWGAFAQGWVVETVAPLLAAALAWLGSMSYLAAAEALEKARARKVLSQYVSPAVLAEVVDKYDEIRAEVGRVEEMTILFCDLRGFTSASEALPAEDVVKTLNLYLSTMTEVIFAHEGTLDKFIGDAIMAFWGAPLRDPDHAAKAVRGALAMVRAQEELNRRLLEQGLAPVRMGIGLNSGSVVLGNIGSERKLDYTVIGDNVNLASRMEGLTAHYGWPLLITDATRRDLGERVICALVDRVRVKGRKEAVAIYRPLALAEDPPALVDEARRLSDLSAQAFSLYQQRRWSEAHSVYAKLSRDPIAGLFCARCQNHLSHEPSEGWDGVYELDRK